MQVLIFPLKNNITINCRLEFCAFTPPVVNFIQSVFQLGILSLDFLGQHGDFIFISVDIFLKILITSHFVFLASNTLLPLLNLLKFSTKGPIHPVDFTGG